MHFSFDSEHVLPLLSDVQKVGTALCWRGGRVVCGSCQRLAAWHRRCAAVTESGVLVAASAVGVQRQTSKQQGNEQMVEGKKSL